MECVSCHPSAETSTLSSDNLLPRSKHCDTCHKDMGIKSPREVPIAGFSHSLHLKMGNAARVIARAMDAGTYLAPFSKVDRARLNTQNACAACHRGIEEAEEPSPKLLPAMADCLVCHSKIENPFSCTKCHAAGMQLKPVNHTADFLDSHTTGKLKLDKTSCAVCHGRTFTCLGCH